LLAILATQNIASGIETMLTHIFNADRFEIRRYRVYDHNDQKLLLTIIDELTFFSLLATQNQRKMV